jgi:acyl transferase domain-containing protein/phosphopantetheinyl transferase
MRERFPRDLAIVGMACVFPGAPDLDTFWRNVRDGVDAITDVPPGRWDPVFYDPGSDAPDRFYCKRGGFIDAHATFDALGFGVMPVAAEGAEPDQLLALQVAARALGDAGYEDRPLPRGRTGVVLGRGNYIGAGMTRLEQHVRTAEQLVVALRSLLPDLGEAQLAAVKREFQAQLGAYGPDTAIGLVPNLTASRIANRLDLHGPAYTLDAACASALVAVDVACRDLADGRCDLMIAGGVHLSHDPAFWSVFCQLGALSRSEQIRPFDRRADGLLIGEGVGIAVLKRLSDAERDGDRIYAVIRGCGVASDGREASLMNPRVDGQLLALRRAWRAAGIDPETLGMLEAHGTGTPTGDEAELATLASFFGGPPESGRRAVVGSVKSMIGHAMPAAGAASLLKAALALYHGVLPPTLHCEEPHPRLGDTRFRVLSAAEPWERTGVPRRAAVNAFGFGGINAHVIAEAHGEGGRRAARAAPGRSPETEPEPLLVLAGPTPEALLAALDRGAEQPGTGPCRLALVDPTPERRERARAIVARGEARRGRDGIWFAPRGMVAEGRRVALLFPGVEAVFEPRVEDVARHFGLDAPPAADAGNLEQFGAAIVALGRLLNEVLGRLGVRPDALAGHSIGEWTGMIASGMIPDEALDAFLASLVPGTLEVPGVVFAAAGCGEARAAAALEGLADIAISHDNCPHQVILCGREESVDEAARRLRAGGVLCQKLPFRSGFHSPLFADYLSPHQERLSRLRLQPAKIPLWSATTCAPYPDDPDAVRALAAEHLVRPVRFREVVEALYADGVRIFVQAGAGSLVGFVEDTLRGRPHLAMSATVPQRSGVAQLRRLSAALFVEGVPVDLARLGGGGRRRPRGRPMSLSLGVPLVRLKNPIARAALPGEGDASDPVLAGFRATMRAVAEATGDVYRVWRDRRAPRERATNRTLSVETVPALRDHCLFPQPEGWPNLSDRQPVVPMTTSIALMVEAASALVSGRLAVAVEDVHAFRWLAVEPPVEVTLRARLADDDAADVAIEGYAEGRVRFADSYPPAPPQEELALAEERPAPISAMELYSQRWMFHGPAFQGIEVLGPMGRNGIRGVLVARSAPGALLDNAGQLFGFWVMAYTDVDRLAMPVRVDRVTFFGTEPEAGERVECAVRLTHLGPKEVRADMMLAHRGRIWARIEGWEDRRFDTDARLWPILREPERHLLSVLRDEGWVLLTDAWRSAPSREYLARRYLGERERSAYQATPPGRQRSWLNGRIAAKDAVRAWLWRHGHGPLFPVEIEIDNDARGRPFARGPFPADLRVSISHKDDLAAAIVSEARDVGIDLERVEARAASFEAVAFDDGERALLPAVERDEWLARAWAAKESVAKARGTGLGGNPRRFPLSRRDGERLLVDGLWVETRREGDHVVAWVIG